MYLCPHDPRRAASGTAQGQGVHTVPVGPYMSPRESSCSPRIRLKTAEKGACLGATSSGVFLKVLQKCDGAQPCATCTSSSRADECRYQDRPRSTPGRGPAEGEGSSSSQGIYLEPSPVEGESLASSQDVYLVPPPAAGESSTSSQSTYLEPPAAPDVRPPTSDEEIDLLSLLGLHPAASQLDSFYSGDWMTVELAGLPGGGPIEEGTFAFPYFPAPTEDPVGNNPDFPLDPELFPREMEDFFE